ncbi:uncharacterized protein [Blastocystis hominis]|uniref:UBC core domain-containing protein n=1 Tax=Blastocystis hominis TaxID=12968 RepID=D8MAW8_BLAHO|nr:uncharacterized protein [Blastocystis hominis]CBK25207.2 unnamed protein product [Blastocystis hominis]|eukprot:XP_012899255.1 uncharacterized protein [Blastocystis hominis]
MNTASMKAKQARRLAKELENAQKCTNPYIWFRPLPDNQLIWHFTIRGPDKSPYEGGVYHGRIELPDNFPFSAPNFYMMTENGRFKINQKICFNISAYHNESWQAATSSDIFDFY